ncbi:MAG: hypothetical protein JW904_01355, partial [Spirochaetales bacterium]|nr:hypothetical protein [Spirochaetales bacterium]
FQQPVSADGIRIIPFNHQSPGYLYYNRANTIVLILDNNSAVYSAPPGVIIREIAFPRKTFSRCTIIVQDEYRGTDFDQLRIAEIEFRLDDKKYIFTDSLEYKKVTAFDLYPEYRSPSGKKIINSAQGTFFCFPNQRYAQGNFIFKQTGYWSFNPYTMRIQASENRAATVEGTGNSLTVTEPYETEYYEEYQYKDIEISNTRSIDWLDAVYRSVHLKEPGFRILPVAGTDWQMLVNEETPAVENYIEKQEERYKDIKEKKPGF